MIQYRRSLFTVLMPGIAFAASLSAALDRPPDPWPGPTGVFVFVEAEDFSDRGAGWDTVRPKPGRYGDLASSAGGALSGGPAGKGIAAYDVEIPEAGAYSMHIRYSEWPGTDARTGQGAFRFVVEQGGTSRLDRVFADAKVGPESKRAHTAVMRWDRDAVTLAKGSARLSIAKVGQEQVANTLRWVDCILLTPDTAYAPDHRDFNPQTYMRIRLKQADPASVYMYCFVNHTRSPWYENTYMDRDGWHYSVRPRDTNTYLTAGESTPWMNLTRLTYLGSDTIFKFMATVKYHTPDASSSAYDVDFAVAPSDAGIVKTVSRGGPGAGLQVRVPPALTRDSLPMADYEYAAERRAMTARMPPVEFGRRATRFPLMAAIPGSLLHNAPGTREAELAAAAYLGLNGTRGTPADMDVQAGVRFGTAHASIWHMGPAGFMEPDLDKIEARVRAGAEAIHAAGRSDRLVHTMLMDEASARSLAALAGHELNQEAFRAWMRKGAVGAPPVDEAGCLPDGTPVRLETSRDGHPALYYFSQRFRAWTIVDFFRRATEIAERHYPRTAPTTQNFSDGAVYMANMYSQGNDYFDWFRNRALACAHSEDWTNLGATHELCGWNVALLRSAVKYHDQPIHMYCITSYGRTPLVVKLKAYSDIAEGAKALSFFAFSPQYAGHERGWAENWEMYPAVAELTHEVGAAEDLLIDAVPRKAETAIIYSIPYDIWNVEFDNTQGHERMFTYLALRHAQVPVDVLSDTDVGDGLLDGYRAAYLCGEQIGEAALPALASWVRKGGTLVLYPGAATRDALNRLTPTLDRGLGLDRPAFERLQTVHHSSLYVCRLLQPQGRVRLGPDPSSAVAETDLLACRQALNVSTNAQVLAWFEDGQPAAATLEVGAGRVVLLGFMPGLAYMRGARLDYEEHEDDEVQPSAAVAQTIAATDPPAEGLAAEDVRVPRRRHAAFPTAYAGPLRNFIVRPALAASIRRPVELSESVVEATFMESPRGWVVPLANYRGEPVEILTVTLRPGRPIGAVRSSRLGELPIERDGDVVRVRIPLESTDMLFGAW